MNIRKLTINDLSDYRELRLRALKEHPEAFSSPYQDYVKLSRDQELARMRQRTESSDGFILGAFQDTQLVGVVGFMRESGDKLNHKGIIFGMHVAAEAQGKGIGRALLCQAIEQIRLMHGMEQVNLGVNSSNQQARNLYISLGFETYGVEKNALRVDNQYFDEEHMSLQL